MHGAAGLHAHAATGGLLDDVPGVAQRPGEPVELGDHQGVPGAAGGQRLAQAGSQPAGTGQAVVDVDALGVDAGRRQAVALGGEVLLDGRHPGVVDLQSGHGGACAV